MGQQEKAFEKEITVRVRLRYLLFLPEGYGQSDERWPLLLCLHGRGQSGQDQFSAVKPAAAGPSCQWRLEKRRASALISSELPIRVPRPPRPAPAVPAPVRRPPSRWPGAAVPAPIVAAVAVVSTWNGKGLLSAHSFPGIASF
jgi:hypothetical protein